MAHKGHAKSRATAGDPPTALITGASAGIGAALARCFARAGYRVVLVARSADKLHALANALSADFGVPALPLAVDLAQSGAATRIAARLKRRRMQIDVLVNNAGVLEQGLFAQVPAQRHRQLIDLNVAALTAMLAQFVPPMIERGHGRILNVASIAAFQPVPTLAVYAATKAYVLSLSESLAEELRDTGVTVTALCPGITATGMLDAATKDHARLKELPGFVVGDVDAVAAEGFRACMNGEPIAVPGAVNRAAITAARMAPKWLVRRIGGALGRRTL
ncbi:MAG: SDR family NAD(P)-dependent oxidoreductase [Gemmatimonadota bacterium]